MPVEHLLPNNTSGTAGHYEETSEDSLVLLNARATDQAVSGQGEAQRSSLHLCSALVTMTIKRTPHSSRTPRLP